MKSFVLSLILRIEQTGFVTTNQKTLHTILVVLRLNIEVSQQVLVFLALMLIVRLATQPSGDAFHVFKDIS